MVTMRDARVLQGATLAPGRTFDHRREGRTPVLLAAVALGLLPAACSGTDPTATPPTPLRPAAATTGAPGTTQPRWTPDQQAVVDAYLRSIGVVHDAQRTGTDPGDTLDRCYVPPLLDSVRSTLSEERAAGHTA